MIVHVWAAGMTFIEKIALQAFDALVYCFTSTSIILGANLMSKGMDSKKQGKKEPAKTMKEKRAAKKAKKESKGAMH